MSKIIALDLGDVWTGIAISDASQTVARPLATVKTDELTNYLSNLITEESIIKIVVGSPKTMKGGESAQTRKTREFFVKFQETFSAIESILWDERLSSRRAETLHRSKNKEDKIKSHARAAAFILDSYLTFLKFHQSN